MSDAIAISVNNLSKCYRIFPSPQARLIQGILGHRKQLYRNFWALRDINFELRQGQTLGVVGRNGSGKSTLLQILCGTLTPTEGQINCHGRIAGLLELGSGFNPEFTGIENIFLNASLLGLKQKDIDSRLDSILAFADIGEHIHQPVKTYSSGMALRLAFAVQANIEPDILIVDEALAVGDELFQKKCFSRLSQLKQQGTSILLVTHSCAQIIQHCDQSLLLHKGQQQLLGQPSIITTTYQQLANAPDEQWPAVIQRRQNLINSNKSNTDENKSKSAEHNTEHDPNLIPQSREIYPSEGIMIESVTVEYPDGRECNQITFGAAFQLRFKYRATSDHKPQPIRCGCHIANNQGLRITGQAFPLSGEFFSPKAGTQWDMVFSFGAGLLPGVYFIGGGIWPADQPGAFLHRVVDFCAMRILSNPDSTPSGICDLSSRPAELIQHSNQPT